MLLPKTMIQDMLTQPWVAEQAMDGHLPTAATEEEAMLVIHIKVILDILMTRTRMILSAAQAILHMIPKIGPIGALMTMMAECILTNGTTKLTTMGDFWMITSNWSF